MTIRTTKINTGLYQFTHKGRTFQVEDTFVASDGQSQFRNDWNVYEMTGHDGLRREWCNDYMTKRTAIARTVEAVDEGC